MQALDVLFSAPFGKDLVFKGGTSLSKAYQAIRRFSEDIDITYDIRALAPISRVPAKIRCRPRAARNDAGRGPSGPAWRHGLGNTL